MTMSAETWTIQRLLQWSIGYLTSKGLTDTPRLDAELLLSHALKVSRVYLYTHFDRELSPAERDPYRSALLRRGQGEPIAYILGTKEFYGHVFDVTPSVLIPRPDTEIVVEAATQAAATLPSRGRKSVRILDVGTGSGCIAISLAIALPEAEIKAWDISPEALAVARRNAAKLGVDDRVHFVQCDALSPAPWQESAADPFDLIVSNPPYIADAERQSLSSSVVSYEPHSALFAADDGLIFYKQLASLAGPHLGVDGQIILEIGASQAKDILGVLAAKGWTSPRVIRDLGRNDRCIVASHPRAMPEKRSASPVDSSSSDIVAPETVPSSPDSDPKIEGSKNPKSSLEPRRVGASAAGEPVYAFLDKRHLDLALNTAHFPLSEDLETKAPQEKIQTPSNDDRTYIPLDPFGRPKRAGATRSAPIEYVSQSLSGAEEELLSNYATENASDLETEP